MTRGPAIRIDVDLTDPATFVRRDPRDFWQQVRAEQPVSWHPGTAETPGFWVLCRYSEVVRAYDDATALVSSRGTVLDVLLRGADTAGGKMLAVSDGPHHRKLRNLFMRVLSPRVLDEVVQKVETRAATLMAEAVAQGSFDFATAYAEEIPMTTICDLLSIPEQDRKALLEWNKLALSWEGPDRDLLDSLSARNDILLYFTDLVRSRRANPGTDVVSIVATAEIDGAPLTEEDAALNCYALILGGDESSRMSAICAVHALARYPAQWRDLRDGVAGIDTAVEEILRWATPAMHFARTAARDLEIGGQHIRAGDIVTMWNTSANDDETVFHAPREFNLHRTPNKHLSFGHGPHFCLGAYLGRAELRALLKALRGCVTSIELTAEPSRIYSNFLFGYSALPVAFA